jgi:hypothetical protein
VPGLGRRIALDVARGLHFLHTNRIVHMVMSQHSMLSKLQASHSLCLHWCLQHVDRLLLALTAGCEDRQRAAGPQLCCQDQRREWPSTTAVLCLLGSQQMQWMLDWLWVFKTGKYADQKIMASSPIQVGMAQIQRNVDGRLTADQNPVSTFAWAVCATTTLDLLKRHCSAQQ